MKVFRVLLGYACALGPASVSQLFDIESGSKVGITPWATPMHVGLSSWACSRSVVAPHRRKLPSDASDRGDALDLVDTDQPPSFYWNAIMMLASKMKFRRLWIVSVTLIACTAEARQHANPRPSRCVRFSLRFLSCWLLLAPSCIGRPLSAMKANRSS